MEEIKSEQIVELAKAAKDGKIEVIIRTGLAEEKLKPVKPIEKVGLKIIGSIGTISNFLKKRHSEFNPINCHIVIDEQEGTTIFNGNECQDNNEHSTIIAGSLSLTKQFKDLSINTGEEHSSAELARYLKKRRNLFTDPEQFKLIWGALSSFEGEIEEQIRVADDKRGNVTNHIKREVTHNLPKNFQLAIQVFENAPKLKFEVEVEVNSMDLSCSLISFDLDEKIEEQRKELIQNELDTELYEGMLLKDYCVVYYC